MTRDEKIEKIRMEIYPQTMHSFAIRKEAERIAQEKLEKAKDEYITSMLEIRKQFIERSDAETRRMDEMIRAIDKDSSGGKGDVLY